MKKNNLKAKAGTSSDAKKVPILPLRDKVVLEEIKEEGNATTASGIIIPESANSDRDTKKGKVVAVGEGRKVDFKLEPVCVKVGQKVIYSWGDHIKIDGKKYVLVSEENISAVIQD